MLILGISNHRSKGEVEFCTHDLKFPMMPLIEDRKFSSWTDSSCINAADQRKHHDDDDTTFFLLSTTIQILFRCQRSARDHGAHLVGWAYMSYLLAAYSVLGIK